MRCRFGLKGKTKNGKQMLTFTGPTTGTTFSLPIDVRKAKRVVKVRTKPGRVVAARPARGSRSRSRHSASPR